MTEPQKPDVTVKEASDRLGIPVRTLHNMILGRSIRARKISEARTAAYLIPADEVDRLADALDRMRTTPGVFRQDADR